MHRIPRFVCLAVAALGAARAFAADKTAVDFVRDIQPIFVKRCYECHGEETRESGLRLDRKEGALEGGDSGKVIEPGKPDESILLELVNGDDPDRVMPPEGETLTDEQIELLTNWIKAGAPWPDDADKPVERSTHWAYQPIRRLDPPAVGGDALHPIDAFVRARLAKEGLSPSPEADRYTLIKRLHYDLLGLPPTVEAVDRFVRDESPDAYEKLVDELLASPHFGERWGRHWLDKARYADSDGYEKDNPRYNAWKYRDWVIDAVNDDLPFDRFTIEQLAGDLLPGAGRDQLVATGFNRQTLTNTEGGVDPEEFRVEAVFDRVETLGAVWLGLTVGCARCHSHKYDAISQREYYELFAFFNNGDETTLAVPTADEPMERYQREKAAWDARLAELQQPLDAAREKLRPAFAAWEAAHRERLANPQSSSIGAPIAVVDARSEGDATLARLDDGSWLVSGEDPLKDVYVVTLRAKTQATSGADSVAAIRVEALAHESLPKKGPGRSSGGNFVLSEITLDLAAERAEPRRIPFASASADFSQKGYTVDQAIDGKEDAKGWGVGGQIGQDHWATFRLREPIPAQDLADATLTVRLSHQYERSPHALGRFRVSALTPGELDGMGLTEELRKSLALASEKRDEKQQAALFDHFASLDADVLRRQAAVDAHRKQQPFKPEMTIAVLRERTTEPRTTHLFRRGSFLEPLAEVSPDTLATLHDLPAPEGRLLNRLDLAQWLVAPQNPLTPRVAVNQMWSHLFGQGLVKTVNDFGVRGEPPSHPELLDWLASEFVRRGWSRKALLKSILMSQTYRQSSANRPEVAGVDAENRLLSRQNRLRVEGEVVRDLYLAASGLLEPRIGGPSVFPPLPPGIAELSYANRFKWGESDWNSRPDNPSVIAPRDDVHRRGLYTFFKRTAAHPNLTTFDCPDSNTTCVARRSSNTPLQALQTLNNESFVEASQALARRTLANGAGDDVDRLATMFRRCVARPPASDEVRALESLLTDARAYYADRPEDAAAFFGARDGETTPTSEGAAWTAVARVVLNLDEFVTRE